MVKVDIGCGYDPSLHYPKLDYDVHLELFLALAEKDFIEKLKNPIIASAEYLPFKDNVFIDVNCRAVLEHLKQPEKALKDIRNCMIKEGRAFFTIPIIVNHFKHYLYLVFIAFPFGIKESVILTKRVRRNIKRGGLLHVSDIKPKHICKYFKKCNIKEMRYRHKWFYGKIGKIIRKYLTFGREPIKDIQGEYEVEVWK